MIGKKRKCDDPCVWEEDPDRAGRYHCTGPDDDDELGVTTMTMLQLAECAKVRPNVPSNAKSSHPSDFASKSQLNAPSNAASNAAWNDPLKIEWNV